MTNIFYWTLCFCFLGLASIFGIMGYVGTIGTIAAGCGCIASMICGFICALAADESD